MRNTFGVITHRISIDEVLEMYKGKDAMFYGDPFNISTDELKDILNSLKILKNMSIVVN